MVIWKSCNGLVRTDVRGMNIHVVKRLEVVILIYSSGLDLRDVRGIKKHVEMHSTIATWKSGSGHVTTDVQLTYNYQPYCSSGTCNVIRTLPPQSDRCELQPQPYKPA